MSKDWQQEQQALRDWMAQHSLYREEDEHSSCGVGLVVNIDGKPSRKVVQSGIDALKAIWHRGAVDADGLADLSGIHRADAVDIGQGDRDAFPGRNVDASNTSHALSFIGCGSVAPEPFFTT